MGSFLHDRDLKGFFLRRDALFFWSLLHIFVVSPELSVKMIFPRKIFIYENSNKFSGSKSF